MNIKIEKWIFSDLFSSYKKVGKEKSNYVLN
jgi:hypothetical protein